MSGTRLRNLDSDPSIRMLINQKSPKKIIIIDSYQYVNSCSSTYTGFFSSLTARNGSATLLEEKSIDSKKYTRHLVRNFDSLMTPSYATDFDSIRDRICYSNKTTDLFFSSKKPTKTFFICGQIFFPKTVDIVPCSGRLIVQETHKLLQKWSVIFFPHPMYLPN